MDASDEQSPVLSAIVSRPRLNGLKKTRAFSGPPMEYHQMKTVRVILKEKGSIEKCHAPHTGARPPHLPQLTVWSFVGRWVEKASAASDATDFDCFFGHMYMLSVPLSSSLDGLSLKNRHLNCEIHYIHLHFLHRV